MNATSMLDLRDQLHQTFDELKRLAELIIRDLEAAKALVLEAEALMPDGEDMWDVLWPACGGQQLNLLLLVLAEACDDDTPGVTEQGRQEIGL